jgi:hypothetical protein
MTHAALLAYMGRTFSEILEMKEEKGKAYATPEDAFTSLKNVAVEVGLTHERTLFTFMSKHWDVIRSFCVYHNRPSDLEERIDDMIIYLVLLRALSCPDKR